MPTDEDSTPDNLRRASLSPPWNMRGSVKQTISAGSDIAVRDFVKERSRVHEAYIKEQEKSRRIGLTIGAILVVAAMVVVMFAPPGREQLSYWLGAALVIVAAGAAGFRRVWGRAPLISFGADSSSASVPHENSEISTPD